MPPAHELLLDRYHDERAEALEHLDFAITELRAMKMQPALERALSRGEFLKAWQVGTNRHADQPMDAPVTQSAPCATAFDLPTTLSVCFCHWRLWAALFEQRGGLDIMNTARFERLARLTGVVWFLLFILGVVIIGLYDYLPSAESVVDSLTDNSSQVSTVAYIGGISAFFLIWFAGSLRSALGEREGGQGRLSEVAFGGAVATALALAAAFAVLLMAAQRAGADGGISVAEAVTLYDLWERDYRACGPYWPGGSGRGIGGRLAANWGVPDLVRLGEHSGRARKPLARRVLRADPRHGLGAGRERLAVID